MSITVCFVFLVLSWTKSNPQQEAVTYKLIEGAPREVIALGYKIYVDLKSEDNEFYAQAKVKIKNNTPFMTDKAYFWLAGTDILVNDERMQELSIREAGRDKESNIKLIEVIFSEGVASGQEVILFIQYRSIASGEKERFSIVPHDTRIMEGSGWYPAFHKEFLKENNNEFTWDLEVSTQEGEVVKTDGKLILKKRDKGKMIYRYISNKPSRAISFTSI